MKRKSRTREGNEGEEGQIPHDFSHAESRCLEKDHECIWGDY